jgi:hypothetical protein
MAQPRGPSLLLVIGFLAVISAAGVVQLGLEVGRGERPQALAVFTRKPTEASLRAYERGLEDASWISRRVRPWVQYAQFRYLGDAGEKAIFGRDGWMFYRPSVEYLTRRRSAGHDAAPLNNPVQTIVSFRDQLVSRGIRLLVVPAPNKESVYPERLAAGAESLRPFVSAPTRELLDRLHEAGVEVVDLFSAFDTAKSNAEKPDQLLYLRQDTHWSPAGSELAARTVARHILDRGWVAPGTVEYIANPVPVQHVGDLVRMLQSPPILEAAESETLFCGQVVRRDNGSPYEDDPNSDVLVLGDSFLRIYQQEADMEGAGFIAHLAKELGRPVTSLVNDGGAATLVRQSLSRRPAMLTNKRVVVWEFVERDIGRSLDGWQAVPLPAAVAQGP